MDNKQKFLLKPEAILRFLITDNDQLDTLVLCKSSEVELITTNQSVYEALASVKENDSFKLNKLAKLFEVVDIESAKRLGQKRNILTHERVEELRKLALGDAK
ncbi:MAG: hypothetical protein V1735_06085 [Nanoarchaeota archaeon]